MSYLNYSSVPLLQAIGILAADPNVAISQLSPIRENDSVPLLDRDNCLRLLTLYTSSTGIHDGSDGCETPDNWSTRTGLPLQFLEKDSGFGKEPLSHLWTACYLVECSDRHFLHTAHGIRSSGEWSLIRYLARQFLSLNNVPPCEVLPSIDELWVTLGRDTIEIPEPYERYPNAHRC